jgi:hypothetical protein
MIEIKKLASNSNGRAGRSPRVESMTAQQARLDAMSLLSSTSSAKLFQIVDYLFVGGVMSAAQLGVSTRSMQRYVKQRVVDRLRFTSTDVSKRLKELDLQNDDKDSALLYTLGPVGIEIARMRHDVTPPSGYLAYTLERVLHDVVVNEIVLRLAQLAEAHDWKATWMSKYESSLMRDDQQILEPDALIRFESKDREATYLLEYHNEDKSTRAVQKVRKYENARAGNLWREAWQVDEFPPVLAVVRDQIVGKGYRDGIAEQREGEGGCVFYGRLLSDFIKKDAETWRDFRTKKETRIFPWEKTSE